MLGVSRRASLLHLYTIRTLSAARTCVLIVANEAEWGNYRLCCSPVVVLNKSSLQNWAKLVQLCYIRTLVICSPLSRVPAFSYVAQCNYLVGRESWLARGDFFRKTKHYSTSSRLQHVVYTDRDRQVNSSACGDVRGNATHQHTKNQEFFCTLWIRCTSGSANFDCRFGRWNGFSCSMAYVVAH